MIYCLSNQKTRFKHYFVFIFLLLTLVLRAQSVEQKIDKLLDYNHTDYQLNIKQIDSAITYAEKLGDQSILSNAYLVKGRYIFNSSKYNESLKNYTKSAHVAKGYNSFNYYAALYGIATIKQQLREYEESVIILKECLDYFKTNKTNTESKSAQINTLGRLVYADIKLKKYDEAKRYSDIEFMLCQTKLDSAYTHKNRGILAYYLNDYAQAIFHLNKAKPIILANNDFSWFMTVLHYKAEANLALGNIEQAISSYHQVIDHFNTSKIVNNEIRVSFERLINYYHQQNDKDNELKIINNLLTYDSIYYSTNQIVSNSYFKDYESVNLKSKQLNLSNKIKYSKFIIYTLIISFIVILLLISLKNRRDKNKFIAYITDLSLKKQSIDVSQDHIYEKISTNKDIELKLKEFEANLTTIPPGFNLDDLADILAENKNYLSAYINQTRKLNFSQYINKLRIELIVNRLLEEHDLRNLTIETLSQEAGFRTRKTFSDAFLQHTGFRPSYFIKNLKDKT